MRALEVWRPTVEAELHGLREITARYVPIVDSLALSEQVAKSLQQAFRRNEARGWTRRERLIGLGIFLLTLGNFALNALR